MVDAPTLTQTLLILGVFGAYLAFTSAAGAGSLRSRGKGHRVLPWLIAVWGHALLVCAFAYIALRVWEFDFWKARERMEAGHLEPVLFYAALGSALLALGAMLRLWKYVREGVGRIYGPPPPEEAEAGPGPAEQASERRDLTDRNQYDDTRGEKEKA